MSQHQRKSGEWWIRRDNWSQQATRMTRCGQQWRGGTSNDCYCCCANLLSHLSINTLESTLPNNLSEILGCGAFCRTTCLAQGTTRSRTSGATSPTGLSAQTPPKEKIKSTRAIQISYNNHRIITSGVKQQSWVCFAKSNQTLPTKLCSFYQKNSTLGVGVGEGAKSWVHFVNWTLLCCFTPWG